MLSKALYALPEDNVVKRRKPLFVPSLLAVTGAGLLVLNTMLEDAALNNLKSAIVFAGGTLLVVGALWALSRLTSAQGVPYHRPSRSFMRFEELYFDRSLQRDVTGRIAAGDLDGLLRLPRQAIPAVAVMVCRSRDNALAACQAFEYADLEYRPLSELKVMDKSKI